MPDTRPSIPTLGTLKGVQYFARTSDGQWHYVNHAGQWVTCPPPFLTRCRMCNGTGYKDGAGFAMDPCDCALAALDADPADHVLVKREVLEALKKLGRSGESMMRCVNEFPDDLTCCSEHIIGAFENALYALAAQEEPK